MFAALRGQLEKVRHRRGFAVGGPVPDGMLTDADIAAAPSGAPDVGDAEGKRRDDDLHLRYDRQAEGRSPVPAPGSGTARRPAEPVQLPARRHLHHLRTAVSQQPTAPSWALACSSARRSSCSASSTPRSWLRLVDKYKVSSTFSAPALVRMICSLPKDVKDRYDRSSMRVMIANAAPWSYALKQQYAVGGLPARVAVRGLRVDRTRREPPSPDARGPVRKPGSCGSATRRNGLRNSGLGPLSGSQTPAVCRRPGLHVTTTAMPRNAASESAHR